VATLVLLDRRPLQFPSFLRRHGVGEACSLFEASPCDPATTVDVPFFHVVFFPSSFWPLALRRKGGIVVDWCSGRTKRSARSQGGHPSPPRSSSPSIPPFLRRHGAWEACALLEPSPCEPVDTFDLFYFFHLVFFPSSFRSLALRRKGGTVVGWCSGRTKSSASSRGGHPSPSRSLFHSFPPILRGRGARGYCSLLEPPPLRGVGTFVSLFSHAFFLPLALGLAFVVGGCPYSVLWPIFR